PAREAAVDLEPACLVEARIREFAITQRAGRGPEREIARRLPLILGLVVWTRGIERSVLEIAGRVAIAGPADKLQQLVVAWTPLESVRFFEALRRAVLAARNATTRIVDDSPRGKPVCVFLGIQDSVPVDQHVDALLEDVGVEPCVSCGGLVPNFATRLLLRTQLRGDRIEARMVCGGRAGCCRRRRGRGWRSLCDEDRGGRIL